MNLEELIATDEICVLYHVEHAFINHLNESGLIEVISVEQKKYIHCDRISEFEKLRRLHYDLKINIEGIETIQHLLHKVKELQKENIKLRNRLNLFE